MKSRLKSKKPPVSIWEAVDLIGDTTGEGVTQWMERGFVMICGSILDRRLEILLRLKFRSLAPHAATKKEMDWWLTDSPLPPLGSAGLRVRMAYVLGEIDRNTYGALQRFFKLRNDFAHEEIHPILDRERVLSILAPLPQRGREVWPVEAPNCTPQRLLAQVTTFFCGILERFDRDTH